MHGVAGIGSGGDVCRLAAARGLWCATARGERRGDRPQPRSGSPPTSASTPMPAADYRGGDRAQHDQYVQPNTRAIVARAGPLSSSARPTPSGPSPWRCATAGAASRCADDTPRGGLSQEHPDDRADRGGQDGDLPGGWRSLARAPFLKVEATKFTEVGYVGRDVESMIRDLAEIAVNMLKEEERERVAPRAKELAEDRLLALLLPDPPAGHGFDERPEDGPDGSSARESREKLRKLLREGKLDEREVEIEAQDRTLPVFENFSSSGMEEMVVNISDMFGNAFPKRTKRRRVRVPEALALLEDEEAAKLIDSDKVIRDAVERVENSESSLSMRSTRLPIVKEPEAGRTSAARACSAICCRWSKARP
jgi:hypothetical protein